MEWTARSFSPFKLFRSAALGAVLAMALFQMMHSVMRLDETVSGVVLGVALIPALATGLVRQVATLLSDPDGHVPTIGFAFANILVAIVFFAFIYLELGIYAPAEPGRDVSSFATCLYFSASIITTTGLGEFVPRPETRFIAAVQMIFGYFAFGIVTAATFFLLVHRSRKDAAG
jgi:hypothetical protein